MLNIDIPHFPSTFDYRALIVHFMRSLADSKVGVLIQATNSRSQPGATLQLQSQFIQILALGWSKISTTPFKALMFRSLTETWYAILWNPGPPSSFHI